MESGRIQDVLLAGRKGRAHEGIGDLSRTMATPMGHWLVDEYGCNPRKYGIQREDFRIKWDKSSERTKAEGE
jgi:hypothetical protein